MEQQTQIKTAQKQEQAPLPAEQTRTPERTRLSDAGLTARLTLDGVSLLDLPPQRLEELASFIGNGGMLALLEARTPQVEEVGFQMPVGEPGTVPFQVPPDQPIALARTEGLTAAGGGSAFDPAVLAG